MTLLLKQKKARFDEAEALHLADDLAAALDHRALGGARAARQDLPLRLPRRHECLVRIIGSAAAWNSAGSRSRRIAASCTRREPQQQIEPCLDPVRALDRRCLLGRAAAVTFQSTGSWPFR